MKRYNKAFTLTEMLVALGVVAVLCAIILPMIYNLLPNKNVIMAKRTYYTIQTIVSELINDNDCYPNKENEEDDSRRRVGLGDGYGYPGCSKWGGKYNKSSLTSENRLKKFNTLFFDKLSIEAPSSQHQFVATDDGVLWTYTSAYTGGDDGKDSVFEIHVDVNGTDGPNCGQSSANIKKCPGNTTNYDQYTVDIHADGKIRMFDEWASDAADITNAVIR